MLSFEWFRYDFEQQQKLECWRAQLSHPNSAFFQPIRSMLAMAPQVYNLEGFGRLNERNHFDIHLIRFLVDDTETQRRLDLRYASRTEQLFRVGERWRGWRSNVHSGQLAAKSIVRTNVEETFDAHGAMIFTRVYAIILLWEYQCREGGCFRRLQRPAVAQL